MERINFTIDSYLQNSLTSPFSPLPSIFPSSLTSSTSQPPPHLFPFSTSQPPLHLFPFSSLSSSFFSNLFYLSQLSSILLLITLLSYPTSFNFHNIFYLLLPLISLSTLLSSPTSSISFNSPIFSYLFYLS